MAVYGFNDDKSKHDLSGTGNIVHIKKMTSSDSELELNKADFNAQYTAILVAFVDIETLGGNAVYAMRDTNVIPLRFIEGQSANPNTNNGFCNLALIDAGASLGKVQFDSFSSSKFYLKFTLGSSVTNPNTVHASIYGIKKA